MTENEAKYTIIEYMPVVGFSKYRQALRMAIKALEELKALKVENAELHCEIQAINATMDLLENEIRNKTIDDFAERLCSKIMAEIDDCADELDWINKIAEQLKVGGSNV